MLNIQEVPAMQTISATLITAKMFEGFWDRWISHGLNRKTAATLRPMLHDLESWIDRLNEYALDFAQQAHYFQEKDFRDEAEYLYRVAGLHYNLIQWIFPETCTDKRHWYSRCKMMFGQADELSRDWIMEASIQVDQHHCPGRIRVPEQAKGCVVIVNPMDSSKEELFTYETDFANAGFVTISFDGPGQGESYVFNQFRATSQRWGLFMDHVIDFAADRYPRLPLFLFGTSSGAAWAIHNSCHPSVKKTVAVSPACEDGSIPDYFRERLIFMLESDANRLLPRMDNLRSSCPIMLVHGNQDVMVKNEAIYDLYTQLPQGKRLVEYVEEGHCCNHKLTEIRETAAQWFLEG